MSKSFDYKGHTVTIADEGQAFIIDFDEGQRRYKTLGSAKRAIDAWWEEGGGECSECGDLVSDFMICPDGAEICHACFEEGRH
jgi:hypothetical protein